MGVRVFSLMAMVTTLAVEPMGVPFPPKPAPSAKETETGSAGKGPVCLLRGEITPCSAKPGLRRALAAVSARRRLETG